MSSKENLFWNSLRVIATETKLVSSKEQTPDRVMELYDKALREFPARLQKAIQDGRPRAVVIAYTDNIGCEAADLLSKLLASKGIRITSASGLASDGWSCETEVYANIADIYSASKRM